MSHMCFCFSDETKECHCGLNYSPCNNKDCGCHDLDASTVTTTVN